MMSNCLNACLSGLEDLKDILGENLRWEYCPYFTVLLLRQGCISLEALKGPIEASKI